MWQKFGWAFACDFPGKDFANVQIPGDQCGSRCASTNGCTHFAWSNFNGGTCWMKSRGAKKCDAIFMGHNDIVCGIVGID